MNYDINIYSTVVIVYPIKGRTDFFKYVIDEGSEGIAKDFDGKEMYFDDYNQACLVCDARNKARQTHYNKKN